MDTLNRLFRQQEISEEKKTGQTKRDHKRAFSKFTAALGILAFVLLLLSVTSSLAGYTAFPGVNGKIAFTSDRDGNWEIYVMNPDGSNQTRLTNNSVLDCCPNWSPDGSKIAFASLIDGNNWEVYVMNADGSNQTLLTNYSGEDGHPAWSPDGGKIAFDSRTDGDTEICVMNPDGSNQACLTNNSANDHEPDWSPDGSKIAFHSKRDGNWEVYVMSADGSNQSRLTTNSAEDAAAAWSPDGSKIAFHSRRSGMVDIYVMNADGSNQTRLTTDPTADGSAAWSPDGSKIAFDSQRDGNAEIYVMNADGSNQTRLTNNSAIDILPAWQPLLTIFVEIDIKPGSDPNCFNNDGHGVIPVAILSSADFDATQVDPATISLDGQGVRVTGKSNKEQARAEDVNGDGRDDLMAQIEDQDGAYEVGDTIATLTGETFDDIPIEGTDTICIVP